MSAFPVSATAVLWIVFRGERPSAQTCCAGLPKPRTAQPWKHCTWLMRSQRCSRKWKLSDLATGGIEPSKLPIGVGRGAKGLAGSPAEFDDLLNRAKDALGLVEGVIVKDYWLTTCLYHFSQAGAPHAMRVYREEKGQLGESAVCLFTGGTALVSAWGITKRYSEELDFLAVDLTGAGAKTALKRARSQIAKWLATPLGQSELPNSQDDNNTTGYRKISIPVGDEPDYLKAEIVSEYLGDDLLESRSVTSLMGCFATDHQLARYPELGGFELLCTKPAYTVANKLDALHRRAVEGHFRGLAARVRDLYDLAMIARSEHAEDARRRVPDLAEKAPGSFGRGGDTVPRPDRGYAGSILFRKGSEAQAKLEEAYPSLADFVWGDLPPFGEALELAASLDDQA
ncbi:MAG: nucleotidyl transferase AbiEii/AbiGii toxin family protein [Acidimicrobiia bacterium]|nr:nucleotidyl transferase AbiEii/AbiGii toxin family protein [Acidimicrobiia bacterium]